MAEIIGRPHDTQLIFVFLVETGFHYVGLAGLELLTSSDLPASVSQSTGITGTSHLIWQALCFMDRFLQCFAPAAGEVKSQQPSPSALGGCSFWFLLACPGCPASESVTMEATSRIRHILFSPPGMKSSGVSQHSHFYVGTCDHTSVNPDVSQASCGQRVRGYDM